MENKYYIADNKSKLEREVFLSIIDGKETDLFILRNELGMELAVTNYGCTVMSIMVPDRYGNFDNVVLAQGSVQCMVNSEEPYLNTIIGRYANRIADGKFTLDGEPYELAVNNVHSSLHGGAKGFNTKVWNAEQTSEREIRFTYLSPDGEENYPGNLEVEVVYSLGETDNSFNIVYKATTDKATPVNLTSHCFFNLGGVKPNTEAYTAMYHEVGINADFYLPIREGSIPTGEIASVEGTPFDFRCIKPLNHEIDCDNEQLELGKGYDHCFVLNKKETYEFIEAAICTEPACGRRMQVFTTEGGLQLYTGNWLNGFMGAKGITFPERSAVCFEAQAFPDAPNRSHFPSTILIPGDEYQQYTTYLFSVDE